MENLNLKPMKDYNCIVKTLKPQYFLSYKVLYEASQIFCFEYTVFQNNTVQLYQTKKVYLLTGHIDGV